MLSLRRGLVWLTTAALVLVVAVVGTGAVLARLDLVRFATVLTASMEPGVPTGSVVAGTPVDADELEVGDVVMFLPPAPWTTPGERPVVHRVTSLAVDDGVLEATTQGDANSNPDPWTLDARRTTFFELRAHSEAVGRAVALVPTRWTAFLWTLPVFLLMFHLLRRIWTPEHGRPRHAATA